MMDLKRVAAAAAVTMALTAPALAEGPIARSVPAQNHLQAEQAYRHHYWSSYRNDYGTGYRYGTSFWPGDVAAGIVGGALGTAGAIFSAPFGAGPYAYGGPYAFNAYPYDSYGWCQPGTRFRGEDGLIHMCQ